MKRLYVEYWVSCFLLTFKINNKRTVQLNCRTKPVCNHLFVLFFFVFFKEQPVLQAFVNITFWCKTSILNKKNRQKASWQTQVCHHVFFSPQAEFVAKKHYPTMSQMFSAQKMQSLREMFASGGVWINMMHANLFMNSSKMTAAKRQLVGKCVCVVRHPILEISPLWCDKKEPSLWKLWKNTEGTMQN